jgi:DNA-binding MarR family transcriptional regulator
VRLVLERDTAVGERLARRVDVVDPEVDRQLGWSNSSRSGCVSMSRTSPHIRNASCPATTLGALARAEQVSASTMSRLVSALERDGLVVREPHAEDGRAVVVAASAKGREILERGRERRISELAALLDGLSSNELETLAASSRIIERVSALPPSARSAYAGSTAERRWSGLSDDSTGSGGTSG